MTSDLLCYLIDAEEVQPSSRFVPFGFVPVLVLVVPDHRHVHHVCSSWPGGWQGMHVLKRMENHPKGTFAYSILVTTFVRLERSFEFFWTPRPTKRTTTHKQIQHNTRTTTIP